MANPQQLEILLKGADIWNDWRRHNMSVAIDLSGVELDELYLADCNFAQANLSNSKLRATYLVQAYLRGANLSNSDLSYANLNLAEIDYANFKHAHLVGTDLSEASLVKVDMTNANLEMANLSNSNASEANFEEANLFQAYLQETNLSNANLTRANLSNTNLSKAILVNSKVEKTTISNSWVYGVSVWDLIGEFENQENLIITQFEQSRVTVDKIKIAQFIYLILNNEELRDVFNTLISKTVLILGRFADDKRKAVLNALRRELRAYNLVPVVFDFDRPVDRNITETVKTLAGISFFVIADVTHPKSSPLELQAIIPDYQIPVVPIIQDDELPFSMINDLRTQHRGLLDPLTYGSEEILIKVLKSAIIDPAIEKHNELRLIKAQLPKIRSAKDFLDKEIE